MYMSDNNTIFTYIPIDSYTNKENRTKTHTHKHTVFGNTHVSMSTSQSCRVRKI